MDLDLKVQASGFLSENDRVEMSKLIEEQNLATLGLLHPTLQQEQESVQIYGNRNITEFNSGEFDGEDKNTRSKIDAFNGPQIPMEINTPYGAGEAITRESDGCRVCVLEGWKLAKNAPVFVFILSPPFGVEIFILDGGFIENLLFDSSKILPLPISSILI